MALKAILLGRKIEGKKKELEELRKKDADFEKREEDLATAIEEAETQEDQAAVEEEVEKFETEKKDHDEAKGKLEREIEELEKDLAEEEKKQDTTPADGVKPEGREKEREETTTMATRSKVFRDMNIMEREAFIKREDVKAYLQQVRESMTQKRALTNVGLTIPTVMLGLIRENILRYSKLYDHVNVRPLSGNGRLVIAGTVPEAVWTDCCANLNELDLVFNDVEIDCWKVGGYFAVCNAILEDSDIDLAADLMDAIGQAIGIALDKAIIYGTGTRMPMGIVTRLAETEAPADYPATARTWVDLHTSNIITVPAATTGIDLFAAIAIASGAAKGKYSRGEKVWVMNEATYTYLLAQAMSINAAGAITTGVNGVMPVIGGVIEVLNDVPDYNIIGGYMDLYLLGERAGNQFLTSEHVRFLQDQTVMKGTARYDGAPAIAEGFVAIGVNGTTPTTTATFAPDAANT